jgi:hypothetical protein
VRSVTYFTAFRRRKGSLFFAAQTVVHGPKLPFTAMQRYVRS